MNTVITNYEKKFDVDAATEELVAVYDKHYTDDEVKGLLQFYGSPLGQKVADEAPKIGRELQEVVRATSGKAARKRCRRPNSKFLARAKCQAGDAGKTTESAPRATAGCRAAICAAAGSSVAKACEINLLRASGKSLFELDIHAEGAVLIP